MHKIKVAIDEEIFEYVCSPETNLLGEARKHFIRIPAACRSGGCGVCKVRVIEGNYTRGKCSKDALTDEEEADGYTLACKTFPRSNMELQVEKRKRTRVR